MTTVVQQILYLQNPPYLYEWVPVSNGFPGVRQHLVPVVPPQTFGLVANPADAYHLVVSDPAEVRSGLDVGQHLEQQVRR